MAAVAPKAAAAPQAAPRPVPATSVTRAAAPLTPPKAADAAVYPWPCHQVPPIPAAKIRASTPRPPPPRRPPPTAPLANDAAGAPSVMVIRVKAPPPGWGLGVALAGGALPPPVVVPVAAPAPIVEAEPPSSEADGGTDDDALEMKVIPKAAAAVPPGDTIGRRAMIPLGSVRAILPDVIFLVDAPAAMKKENECVLDPPPVPPEVPPPTALTRRPLVPRPPAEPPTGQAAVASALGQKRNLVNLGW